MPAALFALLCAKPPGVAAAQEAIGCGACKCEGWASRYCLAVLGAYPRDGQSEYLRGCGSKWAGRAFMDRGGVVSPEWAQRRDRSANGDMAHLREQKVVTSKPTCGRTL